jgi:hydroxyacylglutathione hydrolase
MITSLTEKICIVEGGRNGGYPFSHSLYIRDGGGFLVDAGSDHEEITRLRKEDGISAVVMTHFHEDHFRFLSALSGTDVWASAADAPAFESLDNLLAAYELPGTGWEEYYRQRFLEMFHFRPIKVKRIISDGEEVRFGKTRAVAVVAPGHTAGHLCLHFPDDDILFLGDYGLSDFGPIYAGGIDEYRRSARRLAGIGAATNVISHGGPVLRGPIAGKMEAYLAVIDRREEALRDFLREPRTRAEIIALRLVNGLGSTGPFVDNAEWSLLSKHLKAMIDRGEVSFRDGVYILA